MAEGTNGTYLPPETWDGPGLAQARQYTCTHRRNYAISNAKLDRMPFHIIMLKVARKRVLPVLGKDEVDRLLATAVDPYFGILLVCAHTGFRLSETLHLVWREVNSQESSLSVTEKQGWSSYS